MKKHLIALSTLILLTGASCNSPEMADGYQFGDLSKKGARDFALVVKKRNEYCSMVKTDPAKKTARKIALAAIRMYQPAFPPNGICTDLFETVEDTVVEGS